MRNFSGYAVVACFSNACRSACCWRVLDRDAEVDRTKNIANKNVWTTFVKAQEVNARVSCGHRA